MAAGSNLTCSGQWQPGRLVRSAAGAAVLLAAGCAVRPPSPQIEPTRLADPEFLNYLADRPLVTVDEAYRAVLILADGQDTCSSFAQRSSKLTSRRIVRPAWGLKPDQAIDKGSVAFMVARLCRIRGGLSSHLLGSWGLGDRRYALRELIFADLLPEDANEYQLITGGELVGLLHRADQYMEQHRLYPPLPAEMPQPVPAQAGRASGRPG